jgi:hypothetical protein
MTGPPVTKREIQLRVADWLKRINALYADVRTTLSDRAGIECKTPTSVVMDEELMRQFHVPSIRVPVLDVIKLGATVATFKPVGLWVIGANGRIDILSERGAYIVVDAAKFGSPANWKVYLPTNRRQAKALGHQFIVSLVH